MKLIFKKICVFYKVFFLNICLKLTNWFKNYGSRKLEKAKVSHSPKRQIQDLQLIETSSGSCSVPSSQHVLGQRKWNLITFTLLTVFSSPVSNNFGNSTENQNLNILLIIKFKGLQTSFYLCHHRHIKHQTWRSREKALVVQRPWRLMPFLTSNPSTH